MLREKRKGSKISRPKNPKIWEILYSIFFILTHQPLTYQVQDFFSYFGFIYTVCDHNYYGKVGHLKQKTWMDLVKYKYSLVFNRMIKIVNGLILTKKTERLMTTFLCSLEFE